MCARFAIAATPREIASHFALADVEDFPARYNIAPAQPILLVIDAGPGEAGSNRPQRRSLLVRWGLIPGWTKNASDLPTLFNARAETAAEKPSFKAAMRHRRALIPASGFYEWRRDGKNKSQPYWIRPKIGGIVAFGGLMETYSEPGGSEIDTGAILTTAASGDIAHIHDRMPLVIKPQDFARWLDCGDLEPREVADLMNPAEPGMFDAIPVSRKVNHVSNTDPELQQRIDPLPEASRPKTSANADDGQLDLF